MAESIELRCPVNPRKLLAKVLSEGRKPNYVEGNLVEFSCSDCRSSLRKQGVSVRLVLHRYNLLGEMIETVQE